MPDTKTQTSSPDPNMDQSGRDASFAKKLFAPFAGKRFDEITADDITAVLRLLFTKLPLIRGILAGAATGFMTLKVIRLLRIHSIRRKLIRQIKEEGIHSTSPRSEAAVKKLWKLRYRRYRRNRKVLNLFVSKKTRKSPGYRKFLQIMDELHPKTCP